MCGTNWQIRCYVQIVETFTVHGDDCSKSHASSHILRLQGAARAGTGGGTTNRDSFITVLTANSAESAVPIKPGHKAIPHHLSYA